MKRVALGIFAICCVVCSEGLHCDFGQNTNEDLKEAMTQCLRNQTLEKILQDSANSIESDDSSAGSKETPVTKGTNGDVKMDKSRRTKRSKATKELNTEPSMGNNRKFYSFPTTEESNAAETNSNEDDTDGDMCALQCILEKLEMTDSNGLPDQQKFVDVLVKRASGKAVSDLFKESTEECFQQMAEEDSEEACRYSTKLVTCLTEKGRSSCDDWPQGSLPW
ncbi:uncharacterized protein LOC132699209 [Cylas formicarius]|uniref:Odorant binding protein n=1 Tax=Cylas formicarius TaxID=197179 RepID=A0A6B7M074_CYLFO|nr:uncharacterized protein LOC132699209 [Cylas formicarius]QFO46771.1 odorant binding protein [Cylas formicarius]